ncbi:hypothetical protein BLNAU_6079 [Blattamonas nauphoetae]|uniref:Transmembrane protein n=1 Tax=Blattamonas nauphoetae TaxID=2049346 RepID=A0ABQ9Y518_9EUKA|nr:hypothetical protein BLNAU_6079 [Blattamonas nauphoetae]
MTFPYEENSEPLTPFCHVTRWTDCTFHILALIILTIFFIWKHILPSIKTKQFRATISLIPHILLPITCIFRFVADFISVGICGAALDEGITRALLCASSNYIASFAFSIPLVNWARLLERTKKRKIGTTIVIVLIGFFMAIVPAVFLILIWVGYLRNKALGVAINAVELWYCAATSLLLAVCYLVEGIMILRYIHSLSVVTDPDVIKVINLIKCIVFDTTGAIVFVLLMDIQKKDKPTQQPPQVDNTELTTEPRTVTRWDSWGGMRHNSHISNFRMGEGATDEFAPKQALLSDTQPKMSGEPEDSSPSLSPAYTPMAVNNIIIQHSEV